MGWSIGHDSRWGKFGRDIGYGVPSICDHPTCSAEIDRGLSYVCGCGPYGGEHGCGLFFCGRHLTHVERGDEWPQLCDRCASGADSYEPKPDTLEWVNWKLSDDSWSVWRDENPEETATLRARAVTPEGIATNPTTDGEVRAEGDTRPNQNPTDDMRKNR